ncbi:hypothetical protein SpCBS45565_g01648 [Spizellomyces sp. 'palustris']|nr:hypothetical protein SpCBS45565_g01648 [Spizellomyces sp. 'palustris']
MERLDDYSIRKITSKQDFEKGIDIRVQVFVEEQNCPPDTEPDAHDDHCIHFLAYHNSTPVATARLLPLPQHTGHYKRGKPGRICVLKQYRSKGLGSRLLGALEDEALEIGLEELEIHAQCDKVSFYERHGYNRVDDKTFLEDGILHCVMIKILL